VRTYGQFCPIARASELLAEHWSIIILRNILIGCRTFNEIAGGAPGLSHSLLSKRLRELERAGVIVRRDRLPQHRVLVRFDYPTLTGPGRRGWLLVERGDAEICEKHPGGDEDLVVVVNDPVALPAGTWARSNGAARCAAARSK
jgi:DNA-binding HxlR family transcriptional regulator